MDVINGVDVLELMTHSNIGWTHSDGTEVNNILDPQKTFDGFYPCVSLRN